MLPTDPNVAAILLDIDSAGGESGGVFDLADRVAADTKEARDFGFEGTPVFLINGAPVRGAVPVEVLEEFVDVAAKAGQPVKGQ